MERKLLDLEALAELLAYSADWLSRNHGRLTDEHDFPAPLPGFGTPRWDPVAVHRWLDAQDPRAPIPAATPPGAALEAVEAAGDAELAAKLAGRAERLAEEM